jgi:type IV pilus assembly protein PilB
LIDLEVNPKILVSALSLSIAQRLVRKLCNNCKKEKIPSPEDLRIINQVIDDAKAHNKNLEDYGVDIAKGIKIYETVGCDKCNQTGYKGRMGIFEAIQNSEEIENIIPKNPSEREIREVASKQGILNMKEDGIVKVLTGVTDLEEVKSVVDFYEI